MCTKTVFTILDSSQNEVRSRDSKLPSAEVIREICGQRPPQRHLPLGKERSAQAILPTAKGRSHGTKATP